MVDFNPAKEAIKAYNRFTTEYNIPKSKTNTAEGQVIKYDTGVTLFRANNEKNSVIVDAENLAGQHIRLCDSDGDGNFDSVSITSPRGRNIDQYFDDDDDGTFDRHYHSDTKGNHYVEHRAKWYNPMTWFKHNE